MPINCRGECNTPLCPRQQRGRGAPGAQIAHVHPALASRSYGRGAPRPSSIAARPTAPRRPITGASNQNPLIFPYKTRNPKSLRQMCARGEHRTGGVLLVRRGPERRLGRADAVRSSGDKRRRRGSRPSQYARPTPFTNSPKRVGLPPASQTFLRRSAHQGALFTSSWPDDDASCQLSSLPLPSSCLF